jgi:hypothetical protein
MKPPLADLGSKHRPDKGSQEVQRLATFDYKPFKQLRPPPNSEDGA